MNAPSARSWITAASSLREACARYFAYVMRDPEPWQFDAFCLAAQCPESAHKWSRRLGKTDFLGAHLCVFFALFGLKGTHFAAADDQLVQPREYYLNNPFVTDVTADWVSVLGKALIRTKVLTNKNARSTTEDYNIFDEEAALDAHQQVAVDVAKIMTRNSQLARNVHISTPVVGSQFETTYKRLETLQVTTSHPYTDVKGAWLNVREIEQDKAIMPDWLWRQEYLAEFTVPGGVVFPNVTLGPFTLPHDETGAPIGTLIRMIGVDFHGDYGNVVVEWACDLLTRGAYAVGEEIYPNTKEGLDLSFLRSIYPAHRKNVEGGGFNEGFAREAKRYGATEKENTQGARSRRMVNALRWAIFIDPVITPKLYEDVRRAQWDKLVPMKVVKDEEHPCHFLDAGLVGLPDLDGGLLFGPSKRRAMGNLERERDRYANYK